jgi:hypothetical protein
MFQLHDLQIEPLLRKELQLEDIHPKHEVIRFRQLGRKYAFHSIHYSDEIKNVINCCSSISLNLHSFNQLLASVTTTTPLRFITTISGGTLLHILVQNTRINNQIKYHAIKLVLALDSTSAAVFNDSRKLPLHLLLESN